MLPVLKLNCKSATLLATLVYCMERVLAFIYQ